MTLTGRYGETLKARLRSERGTAFGVFITSFDRPAAIGLAAAAGVDFLVLDAEHNAFDEGQIERCCELAALQGMTTLVRTSSSAPDAARMLDLGADGLMISRLAAPEQVHEYVRYSYFPPLGERGYSSWAPSARRCVGRSGGLHTVTRSDLAQQLNSRTMLVIQVETESLAAQVEDVASMDGVDVITVGFSDLTVSRGAPDASRTGAEIQRILSYPWRPGLAAKGCHAPNGIPELGSGQPRAVFVGHDVEFFETGLREAMRPHLARKK